MSSNFLVDFTAFHVFGLLGGLDFMLAFSLAAALAAITRQFDVILLHKVLRARMIHKDDPDHASLPAFRKPQDLEAYRKREARRRRGK